MTYTEKIAQRKEFMFTIIHSYIDSGSNQHTFCQQQNLAKSTFQYWLKKYRNQNGPEDTASFIPIHIKNRGSNLAADSAFVIEFANGCRLYLNKDLDRQTLFTVIDKLAG